jgi:hypothetical protein
VVVLGEGVSVKAWNLDYAQLSDYIRDGQQWHGWNLGASMLSLPLRPHVYP